MPRSESFYRLISKENPDASIEDGLVDKNILEFKFPNFMNTFKIKFPASYLLQVCEECHSKKRTKSTCRVRLSHRTGPWSPIFLCMIFDETCLDDSGNLIDKQFSTRILLDEYHEVYSCGEVLNVDFPVCRTCRRHSLTRHNCRIAGKHKDMPWCTVFVTVTAVSKSDDKNNASSTSLDNSALSVNTSASELTTETTSTHAHSGTVVSSRKPLTADIEDFKDRKLKTTLVAVSGSTCTTITVKEKKEMKDNCSNVMQKMQRESDVEVNEKRKALTSTPKCLNLYPQQSLGSATTASTDPNKSRLPPSDGLSQVRGADDISSAADVAIQSHAGENKRQKNDNVPPTSSLELMTDPEQEIINRYLLSQGRLLGSGVPPGYLSQGGLGSLQESSAIGMDLSLSGHLANVLSERVPRAYNPPTSNPLGIAGIDSLGGMRASNSSLHTNAAIHHEALLRERLGLSTFSQRPNLDIANSTSLTRSRLSDYLSLSHQANLRYSNYDANSLALSRNRSIRGGNLHQELNDVKE